MITKDNFKELILKLGFSAEGDKFLKKFKETDAYLKVDFKTEKLIYPEDKGFKVNERQTCSFSQRENFVVFECVHRLFEKGYKPQHIELEPRWKVGHGASGGRADIMVKDNSGKSLLIIECKTEGKEFDDAWKKTLINGGQLLSYVKQAGSTQFVCLYSSDYLNEKVVAHIYLITLKDNEKLLLELAEKSPLSFEKAKGLDVEDIFQAWSETYSQDYATKGIFEEDIPAYEIGKTKYSLKDLSTISSNDIQGKYHQFATILRQHNVSGRENAFDKLVNLFLCKIVDETNNPEELKFYWKGIAYDDQFSLIDRLQKLYQDGMQRFLGEDVVYISADQIDKAFDFFKNDPDATKDTIKKYFKELKFFNNNDFGFIDVHNEKLFYQNTAILLKIVQMLQDIRLKTDNESASEENQFLGDMFEGFLDQGVKQSEGQFFTPMPIVKFILKSLPLETIITKGDEIPKVIDFACGAGHFLNEYAKEIRPIVETEKEAKITDYYENVFGIEKEYRLSKVAKVSAFMYGQDNINIVYADALSSGKAMDDKNIKDNSFSLLVANPPYSVKGFLETLSESERKKYRLIETVGEKSYPNNNSIETFFIERAKQLLKPGGVAGIIVPSSILTKGKAKSTSKSTNIYVATREILLKYFDIVAIAEFGSGTFGKTGTNTVTLFIRRKKEGPAPADHFLNRVNAWFNFDKTKDGLFEDEHLLKQYCTHLELKFVDYQTLLQGEPNKALLETEIFNDYRKEFDKWSEIKNRKKQKTFKDLSKEEQQAEIEKRFTAYLTENEKEKLYYFVLASQNPQKVIIVKSPSKTTEIKEFLGYEWSAAKGNEGIKYLGGVQLDTLEGEDDDEGNVALEEEDKRVLSNIFNLNNINTPLYDPHNNKNDKKINYLINQNFNGEDFEIPEELGSSTIYSDLVDMMNFKLPNFNKSISLSPSSTIKIESKWKLEKLSSVVDIISGGTPSTTVAEYWNGNIPWLSVADFNNDNRFVSNTEKTITQAGFDNSNTNYLVPDEIILSARGTVGAFAQVAKKMTFNQSCYGLRAINGISNSYLYYVLGELLIQFKAKAYGSKFDAITVSTFDEILIPVPPPKIQKEIVDACSAIDKEAENANRVIEKESEKIEKLITEFTNQGHPIKKVSVLAEVNPSKTEVRDLDDNTVVSFIEMASVSEEGFITHKEDRLLIDVKSGSYRYFKEGDIIIAKITPCMENGKCAIATDLSNGIGFGSSEFHVFRVNEDLTTNKFLFAFLNREVIRKEAEKNMTGSSGHRRVPDTFYKNLQIPVPTDLKVQAKLVSNIEKAETKIKASQELIAGIAKRKEAVIKSYLMGETEETELAMAAEPEMKYKKKKVENKSS
ncbi:Type I restriction-modification system, DNA-methyltransferase subunit M [Fulvivirga imtechensis AK7]|uniref:Type I restriction-modification system, DNA-methyltransferase subunit M n=1 Tax=Fulvivirga imtechensis AK7 TaxID=1237149 RepID=L8JM72_9BACT|nr:restriction endonuclease subunit S [Fulvivirga imtechensis]ELR69910.1 Type I restriction-modification system, DNA-methyltransferase subunit M [Fulvivirga imtechensis AK7]